VKMPPWSSPSVVARTAATPPSDQRSVAHARTTGTRRRTASRRTPGPGGACSPGEGAPRAEGLGRRTGADAEVWPAPAGKARRVGARPDFSSLELCLN
jgi:hypothetical protein